jgi:multimeric flavodoxin WrbA
MAKILGICGSPRKGATEYALKAALEEAAKLPGIETEIWTVRGKKIKPCNHCDLCIKKHSMCVIDDDLKEFYDPFLSADGILIASPVYDMSVTSQLAAVVNRLRPIYLVYPGRLRNKPGAGIAVGGTRHGGQEFTLQFINNFFMMNEMLSFGGPGGCYNGGTIWSKDRKAEGAAEDTVGMDTVMRLGSGLAESVLVTAHGRAWWKETYGEIDESGASPLRDH